MLISVFTCNGNLLGEDLIDSSEDLEGIVQSHTDSGNVVVLYPDDVRIKGVEIDNE